MSGRSPKIQLEEITMQHTERSAYPSWAYGPLGGAAPAMGLAFAYSALFIVYAAVRSSLLVIRVNPDAGVPGTTVAYFFALAVPALVIAAMMAVPAALIGLIAAPILKHVVAIFNAPRSEGRAITIGSATCLFITVLLLVIFQRMLGFTFADMLANSETFLFWFALPSLIFIAAGGMAARQLVRIESEKFRRKEAAQAVKSEGMKLSIA
jgi:hypothetical protein